MNLFARPALARENPSPAQCARAYNGLQPYYNPERLSLPPMPELIRQTGLSPEQGELLRRHAASFNDIVEYVPRHRQMGLGYLLGADTLGGVANLFSSRVGLRHWSAGYAHLNHSTHATGHSARYMDAITASGEPIVFFVPPNIMSKPGATQDEMLWLLQHPERMANVHLVFGAYQVFPDDLIKRFNFTRDSQGMMKLFGPREEWPEKL